MLLQESTRSPLRRLLLHKHFLWGPREVYLCAKRESRSQRGRCPDPREGGVACPHSWVSLKCVVWAQVCVQGAGRRPPCTRSGLLAFDPEAGVTQHRLQAAVEAGTRVPGPGSRPNLGRRRQRQRLPLGGGRRRGSRRVAGCRGGLRLRAPPPTGPHLGRPGRRWLAPRERRSPYHTPARLPGNRD